MTRARILADYVSSGDELALKAPLAGPTFTGTVAIPNVANLETAVVANTAKVTNYNQTLADINALDITELGTVTSGNLSNSAIVYPTGHVVKTYYTGGGSSSGHTSTSNTALNPSGILVSTGATTGSQYNIITFTSGMQGGSGVNGIAMYKNMNGAGYVELTNNSYKFDYNDNTYIAGSFTWVDTAGLTAGTNIYQMYHQSSSGTFYSQHSGIPYALIVKTIQA